MDPIVTQETDGYHSQQQHMEEEREQNVATAYQTRPWYECYYWLEVSAWTYYLVLALVMSFSALPYFRALYIPLWYAPHIMFPVSFMSVGCYVGPPPLSPKQLLRTRHKMRTMYALVTGLLATLSGIAFLIKQVIYVFSDACSSDPQSVCGVKSLGVFVMLVIMCKALVLLAGTAVVTVFNAWRQNKSQKRTQSSPSSTTATTITETED